MKTILIVITVIALAAMSYGPGTALSRTADVPGSTQSLSAIETEVIANPGSVHSSPIYLCAENGDDKDDSDDKKGDGDGEKSEPEVPGIDRIWNVVTYG